MNNGSKSTQALMPSGIQHNTSSPVGATSNLHIQKETISHERGIIGETSASLLPPSGSNIHSAPVSKSSSKTNVTESTATEAAENPKQQDSSSTPKNKPLSNIGDQSSKPPCYGSPNRSTLNWSKSADSSKRIEGAKRGNGSAISTNPDGSKQDPVKSSKPVKSRWKEAASMSKLGNRTKSLFKGKFKPHSQSVDMVNSQHVNTHTSATSGTNSSTSHGPNSILPNQNISKNTKNGAIIAPDPSSTTDLPSAFEQRLNEEKVSAGKKAAFKQVHPPIGQINNELASDTPTSKAKTQWSEHVWTAWVHRGFSDDVTEKQQLQPGHELISDFQKDKFRHFFFHVLDHNADCVISLEDFEKLNERIRHYMDWSKNTTQFLVLKEIHTTFLDSFLTTAAATTKQEDDGFDFWDPFKNLDRLYDKMEHASLSDVLNVVDEPEPRTCVTVDEWIDVWGTIVGKAKNMEDLPMWLQYYPRTLFEVVNRTGTGVITKSELKHFYTAFMDVGKLGDKELDDLTTKSFNALTSNSEVKLTYHIYKLSFMNFLLGKQPNGPGQFLFGAVQPKAPTCMFPIDYSAMNATEEDMEPFRHDKLEEKGSRRSVIV